jgi:hypothetical protein
MKYNYKPEQDALYTRYGFRVYQGYQKELFP